MATLCSKCSAELSPHAHACGACGAPVAGSPLAAAPAPAISIPAPPKQSSALKISLVVAMFVGLGILGVGVFGFFVYRLAHAVHASDSSQTASVNVPDRTFTAIANQSFTASDLGTDIYPGAQAGKGNMRVPLPSGSMVTANYLTADSKAQVLNFYKNKFGSAAAIIDAPIGTVLSMDKGKQDHLEVTITPGDGENAGKTRITIERSTSTRSQ